MKKNILRALALLVAIFLGYMVATDAMLRWFNFHYLYAFNICYFIILPFLVHLMIDKEEVE